MGYILSERVKIDRPMFFLCGPYFNNNSEDRRNVLREEIHRIYFKHKQEVLPLIVDCFLTSDNIDFSRYSVQLLEEICASVSSQTHIFLDTMSSATELGIFANSAYNNEICVYIPKQSDVYNKRNVGSFVREAVLKKPGAKIHCLEYRPRIIKKAYSSFYIAEHFGFNENMLPKNIVDLLENKAKESKLACDVPIEYLESGNHPAAFNQICYMESDDTLLIKVSIKLLFYIVYSILHLEHEDIIKGKVLSYDDAEEKRLTELVKEALASSVSFAVGQRRGKYKSLDITTIVEEKIDTIVSHMIKFDLVYYAKSQFRDLYLLPAKSLLVNKYEVKDHPDKIIALSKEQMTLVDNISKNPELFFEQLSIFSGKKERKIIKYKDTSEGENARKLHNEMNEMFRKGYKHSKYSFAYHKGRSIKDCVEAHKESCGFIKFDIKKFFSSISKEKLLRKLSDDLNIDEHFYSVLDRIISACYYNTELPLGLVMSPILSDYYLFDFDTKMGTFCKKRGFIYTRYADDIMVSSTSYFDNETSNAVCEYVAGLLGNLGLSLNDEKFQTVNIGTTQNFVRYVGINIVKGEGGSCNYLSVGKKYIYQLAKDYLEYTDKCNSLMECTDEEKKKQKETEVFYTRAEIIGKIGFIKSVEGEKGVKRLASRLSKYYPNVDLSSL